MSIANNKNIISDFVTDKLSSFTTLTAIFWAKERIDEPTKPYFMMRMLNDNDIKPTSEQEIDGNINKVTRYRDMVVTFAIYVDGVGEDIAANNDLATNIIEHISEQLDTIESTQYLYNQGLSIGDISGIRDLSQTINGGFFYRYEFDCHFSYDDTLGIQGIEGKQVDLQTNNKNVVHITTEV
jgi:hypothetical protein